MIVEDHDMSDRFFLSVPGLDATTKILFCPSVVASGNLSVRIIIILFSSVSTIDISRSAKFLSEC
jgi:hypothetical protein